MDSKSKDRFSVTFDVDVQLILDALPDAFYLCNQSGRILDANLPFCEMLGYERAQLIGKSLEECVELAGFGEWPVWTKDATASHKSNGLLRCRDNSTLRAEFQTSAVHGGFFLTMVRPVEQRVDSCLEFRDAFTLLPGKSLSELLS